MKRCVFFDRDGIINRSPGAGYVERLEDFHILPACIRVLHAVKEAGYAAVVITNQQGIARGCIAPDTLDAIHDHLRRTLATLHGLTLLDILVCPHLAGTCTCRKPLPGMLLEAANRHALDLPGSWMIGDNETDIQAGHSAGCRTIRIAPMTASTKADRHFPDMDALAENIARILDTPRHPEPTR